MGELGIRPSLSCVWFQAVLGWDGHSAEREPLLLASKSPHGLGGHVF